MVRRFGNQPPFMQWLFKSDFQGLKQCFSRADAGMMTAWN
jgi:hypothetical protein